MSIEDTTRTTSPLESETPSGNDAAIDTLRTQHTTLVETLRARTHALLEAARHDAELTVVWNQLYDWYRTELMPHIEAEEYALYSRASRCDSTSLLVNGMLAEHRTLVARVADFALATQLWEAVNAAVATQAVFEVHLDKEDNLLLPELDRVGVDLAAALENMHEVLDDAVSSGSDSGGCGCGCGCGCTHNDSGDAAPVAYTAAAPAGLAEVLDVRTLPHSERHETIFDRLERLSSGESLVIVNDHDPKPLRYQTQALWPDRFAWSYLEAGPEQWRVTITHAG